MKKKIKQQQEPEKTENNIRREKTGISAYNRTGYKTMIKNWYLEKPKKNNKRKKKVPGKKQKRISKGRTGTWKNRKE